MKISKENGKNSHTKIQRVQGETGVRCIFACKTEGERERWRERAAKMKNEVKSSA